MTASRPWLWAALGAVFFGVPIVACGGRILAEGSDSGTGEAGSTPPGGSSGTATSTATSTSTPTGTGVATGTASGSSSSGSSFGPFPCTAYTAIYNSCPPSASGKGCQYWEEYGNPPEGLTEANGEVAPAGCRIEIVPPTSTGGATCDHTDCVCGTDGAWAPDGPNQGLPCPQ